MKGTNGTKKLHDKEKEGLKQAILYKKLVRNRVQCRACSWYCKINPGFTGICGVRENINGKLYLLVYGKPLHGLSIDPIEKKPLFHFLPGSEILSFGTYGCNFGCEFCQNWHMSQIPRLLKQEQKDYHRALDVLKKKIKRLTTWLPEKIVESAQRNGYPSIAYTYNEPAIFFEYAYDTAKIAHKFGIKNVFISNGYESEEALDKIHPFLDAINIDLKSFNNDFYLKICKAQIKPVLENIKRCFRTGIWTEITTLVIPTLNDDKEELKRMADFIVSVSPSIPWHLSAFHPDYKLLNLSSTPVETLYQAYEIGKKAGLKYIYLGNIIDPEYSSTYCPKCQTVLIQRTWNRSGVINMKKKGICGTCAEKIEGVWR